MLGNRCLAVTALGFYRERFADMGLYENCVYSGIENTLAKLDVSGRRLFVATSKPEPYATRIVEHFAIGKYFERIFGSELGGARSDKTDLLRYALKETGIAPIEATMIGDRSHDVIGARNNAMLAVGVLYGYGSKDELIAAGADRISTRTSDLPQELADLERDYRR